MSDILAYVPLNSTLINQAINAPLSGMGFSRVGRRNVWMREGRGIDHAVSLEYSHGSWKVRWDVVQPAVGAILHGTLAAAADVAYSGIVTGLAQPALRPGVVATFAEADFLHPGLIGGVKLAALQVAEWLDDFGDSRDVILYLVQDFEGRDRGVIVPFHRPLRLFTAAALAAVDGAPDAADLAAEAAEAIGQPRDRIIDERMKRLATALSS